MLLAAIGPSPCSPKALFGALSLLSTRARLQTHWGGPTRVHSAAQQKRTWRASTKASVAPPAAMAAPDKQRLLEEVRQLVPQLTADMHKGSAGKVAVVGGCREYTGAPFFASYSALKMGADLAHVFCTQGAATVIKCYSPELIVHPYLPDSADEPDPEQVSAERQAHLRRRAVAAVEPWLGRFDAVVVGPGLGRDPLMLSTVAEVVRSIRQRGIPMVVDADGLWLVNQDPSLVQGYSNAVLTPNVVEFKRLAGVLGVDADSSSALQEVAAALGGPVVVRKGGADAISDGRAAAVECDERGSLRRAGGQGDVLSGCTAVFAAWAQRTAGVPQEQLHVSSSGGGGSSKVLGGSGLPPLVVAAYGGALITRLASRRAFERRRRAMGATDLIEELGAAVDELVEC